MRTPPPPALVKQRRLLSVVLVIVGVNLSLVFYAGLHMRAPYAAAAITAVNVLVLHGPLEWNQARRSNSRRALRDAGNALVFNVILLPLLVIVLGIVRIVLTRLFIDGY